MCMQGAGRIAILALVLTAVGMQRSAATIEASTVQATAPGTFIWIGNHRLHLNCTGVGSPTVIFDSGLGSSSLDWSRVQPQVASFTRACSYDRAGYGWSDAGPLPRDSANISRELEILLGNGSVPAPYLLVGHSLGGMNVRLFTHNNPGKVVGLVLIDSSHEDQFRRFEQADVGASAPNGSSFIVANAFEVPNALPDDIVGIARSFAVSRSSMQAFRSELQHLRASAKQLQDVPMLPDIPVVVISHRVDQTMGSDRYAKRARIWMDMQAELADRATRGKHVVAATEDHYVHLSQPQLVVDTIKDVIDQL